MKPQTKYLIGGVIFVLIAGSISHFVYELSNENTIVGFFFPVNESIWEHMKLVFFPMLLYSFYLNRKTKGSNPCVASALLLGILVGTWLVPIIFYTYTGILGYHTLVLDLVTFALSVLGGFFTINHSLKSCKHEKRLPFLKILTFIMVIAFFIFTYFPPDIAFFVSP